MSIPSDKILLLIQPSQDGLSMRYRHEVGIYLTVTDRNIQLGDRKLRNQLGVS
ncbi:hypothetical protein KAM448_17270 [Aeromonas caviae]|uniref:Uncharacterized protein n=1 Tax=Aeromonas caviae TaxID=648 RepID=A0AAV4YGG2_AERCA|nr:hypothetical protein KAM334_17870 [Aeromonas caviae]GJA32152.1 hypothetical protein KAM341_18300 [Aeromonas caviae]GJA36011.1 hypothetical protein KAM342_12540 [Aeromonas caviae]GJA39835.1 hypothetical protein KAM343_06310 [Aeromonas caviae]GJA52182.1 hypothetical protein KAM347_39730 [Aeromonas caviae]